MKTININNIKIGNDKPFVFMAGPCVIETEEHLFKIAKEAKAITSELGIPYVLKTSFDKANRSSVNSYRGPGFDKGIDILKRVKDDLKVPILCDVHETSQVKKASEVIDVMQIPAFLCRQTDLISEVAKHAKVINVKKGQFLAPWDVKNIITKIEKAGNRNILLTERGASFGYNNLVVDMRSLMIMRSMGYPVMFDATHSVQIPGGLGESTGGQREFIPCLARAATAVGIDSLFMEVHDCPDKGPCDGPNMFDLKNLKRLLENLQKIDQLVKGY